MVLVCNLGSATQTTTPVILVLGDSLSSAFGLPPHKGWVSLLEQRLHTNQYDFNVVNASITGDTTRGGLARLPQALQRHRPAIVIIELGGNDGLRAINPKEMRDNLRRMTQLSQQHGAKVLLLGVRIPTNYGKAFTQRFEAVFRDVAESTAVPLVPFILEGIVEHPELFQADGIHPTAEAQTIILDNVWSKLEPLLVQENESLVPTSTMQDHSWLGATR